MSVGAASVALGPAFAVVAFTLHGRVLDETQQPVAGVCVRVNANGREGECSDAQGFFHVSDMEEREYMIDVVMRKEFHTGGGQSLCLLSLSHPGAAGNGAAAAGDLALSGVRSRGHVAAAQLRSVSLSFSRRRDCRAATPCKRCRETPWSPRRRRRSSSVFS